MADFADTATNFGANYVLGRAGNAMGVPLPNFTEIQELRHGQAGRAARSFGGRQGGRVAGATIGGTFGGPLGAWLGGMIGGWAGPHVVSAISGHGWNDNSGYDDPVGTVTVGDINDTSSLGDSSNHVVFDPWTGTTATIPNFSGNYSNFGPYANGYQGLPQQPDNYDFQGGNRPTMPDFSNYGDALAGNTTSDGDYLVDENADGHVSPQERRDANSGGYDWQRDGPSAFGSGVTNFMVGGSPVITGYRPAGGDMNQLATYNGRDWGG